jgi:hypothetical protein
MDERLNISRDQRIYISNSNNSFYQSISSSSPSPSNHLSTLSYLSSYINVWLQHGSVSNDYIMVLRYSNIDSQAITSSHVHGMTCFNVIIISGIKYLSYSLLLYANQIDLPW